MMNNIPKVKIGIVAVSRDCFPKSLSVNRRKALVPELIGMSDRIMVMRDGEIMGELSRQEVTQEKILTLATE